MNKVKYCRKCNKVLGDSDVYCRNCGSKAVEGAVDESMFISAMVYGPPYSAKYVCENCGEVYIERGLGCPSAHYCPKCGAKYDSPVEAENGFWESLIVDDILANLASTNDTPTKYAPVKDILANDTSANDTSKKDVMSPYAKPSKETKK